MAIKRRSAKRKAGTDFRAKLEAAQDVADRGDYRTAISLTIEAVRLLARKSLAKRRGSG